jgi:ribosomal-protein-alanine N-acetyltransferase
MVTRCQPARGENMALLVHYTIPLLHHNRTGRSTTLHNDIPRTLLVQARAPDAARDARFGDDLGALNRQECVSRATATLGSVLKIHPRFVTERLRLRPFVADDAEELAKLAGSPQIADTMLEWPHPFSVANARSTIAAQAAVYQGGRAIHFAVERRDRAGLVGGIEVCALDNPHRCADLRFWIAQAEWGQGFASEAARAVVRFGFGELGLHRIDAMHLVRCGAAGAVLRKIGMRQEGILRERVRKSGRFEDVALCAVLADELTVG